MNVPDMQNGRSTPASLEAMELEFALGTHTIAECGFDHCVTRAAKDIGATVLFQLPALFLDDCQRAAAILCGHGSERRIVLVLLDADGCSVRIENSGADNPVYCLADSYVKLFDAAAASHGPALRFQAGLPRKGTVAHNARK